MFERVDIVQGNRRGKRRLKALLKKHTEKLRQEHQKKNPDLRGSDVPIYDNSDSERTFKRRKLAPYDTYEIWNQEEELTKAITDFEEAAAAREAKKSKEIKEVDQDETKSDEEESTYEDEDEDDIKTRDSYTRVHYQLALSGLEVLPHITSEAKTSADVKHSDFLESALSTTLTFSRRHTLVLTNLLHINVLKRNWKVAHRCFAMLMRLTIVDIRSIWPIGLEILTRLAEEEFKESQPVGSVTDYKLKTYYTGEDDNLKVFKDEQFLSWLETFYQLNLGAQPDRNNTPYPYRLTSKFNTPLFVYEMIWIMIMKNKLDEVNDKLSELVLRKVYTDQGIFYFLQGFSNQLEASMISKKPDLNRQKIEQLMLNAKNFYQQAKAKGAEFPENLLNSEMNIIKARLAEDLDYDDSRMARTRNEDSDAEEESQNYYMYDGDVDEDGD